jgi:two-component system, OmpR family, response regulator
MKTHRILVVEDDRNVAQTIRDLLEGAGFAVRLASTGRAALRALEGEKFAVAVIDLGLPDVDGWDFLKGLARGNDAGVIVVTGRADPVDRIVGLELGADDYVTKPFEPRELLARVKGLIRRLEKANDRQQPPDRTTFGPWLFDRVMRTVQVEGGPAIELSTSEFRLLSVFVDHPNRVLSREYIIDCIYGRRDTPFDRSVDIAVTRLRGKIEIDPRNPRFIRTVRGEGYRFSPELPRGDVRERTK